MLKASSGSPDWKFQLWARRTEPVSLTVRMDQSAGRSRSDVRRSCGRCHCWLLQPRSGPGHPSGSTGAFDQGSGTPTGANHFARAFGSRSPLAGPRHRKGTFERHHDAHLQAADSPGIRVFAVDAKDKQAKRFYERFDFIPSPTDPMHLLVLLKDVRRIVSGP